MIWQQLSDPGGSSRSPGFGHHGPSGQDFKNVCRRRCESRPMALVRARLRSLVFFGNVQTWPIVGLVFPEEAARVDFAALYLLDELFPDLSCGVDRRSDRAVPILLGAFPIIVLYRLLTGGRDVGSVDDEVLVDRQQVLTFDNELGHRGLSCVMLFKATNPLNVC